MAKSSKFQMKDDLKLIKLRKNINNKINSFSSTNDILTQQQKNKICLAKHNKHDRWLPIFPDATQTTASSLFFNKMNEPLNSQNLDGMYYANDFTLASIANKLDSNTHLMVGVNGQMKQRPTGDNQLLDNSLFFKRISDNYMGLPLSWLDQINDSSVRVIQTNELNKPLNTIDGVLVKKLIDETNSNSKYSTYAIEKKKCSQSTSFIQNTGDRKNKEIDKSSLLTRRRINEENDSQKQFNKIINNLLRPYDLNIKKKLKGAI